MTKTNKNQRLFLVIVSSPIFAIFGLLPFYLFNSVEFAAILKGFLFLTAVFIVIWTLNLLLLKAFNDLYPSFFACSYLLAFAFVFLAKSIAQGFTINPQLGVNIIYPVFSVLVMNSIILLLLNTIEINEKRKKELISGEQRKALQVETEHRLLLNHLKPHVLFNMLSTLKSIINENPKEASLFTENLSSFLRDSLQGDSSGLHTVRKELAIVESYMHLQKSRFGDSFTFTKNIPEFILNYGIPTFSLQTLVENSFKHNLFSSYKPLHISIEFDKKRINVKSSFAPYEGSRGANTGLKSLNERSKILSGDPIIIRNTEQSFEVKVPIKLMS